MLPGYLGISKSLKPTKHAKKRERVGQASSPDIMMTDKDVCHTEYNFAETHSSASLPRTGFRDFRVFRGLSKKPPKA